MAQSCIQSTPVDILRAWPLGLDVWFATYKEQAFAPVLSHARKNTGTQATHLRNKKHINDQMITAQRNR
jgi:hypothetical protein